MENQLATPTINLYQPAIIKTGGVVELKNEIEKLSQEMQTVEINSDNIQHYKKLLASIRAKWSTVDQQRIAIKKEVLEPYLELETDIKEIKAILDTGEKHIKEQLDAITIRERQERKDALEKMFIEKRTAFNAPNWLEFEVFIQGKETLVTNKSTSNIKKVTAVNEFFQTFIAEYKDLKEKFEFEDDRTAILLSYSNNGYNMPQAIEDYTKMIAEKKRLQELQANTKKKPVISVGKQPIKKEIAKKVHIEILEKDLKILDKYGIIYSVIKR